MLPLTVAVPVLTVELLVEYTGTGVFGTRMTTLLRSSGAAVGFGFEVGTVVTGVSGVSIVAGVGSVAPYGIVRVMTVVSREITAVLIFLIIKIDGSIICLALVCAGIIRVCDVTIVVSFSLPGQ